MNILFATPAPPAAIKPRPHHFIRGLAARGHSVHLLMQVASERALENLESDPSWAAVREACATVTTKVTTRLRSVVQCALALPTPVPLRVAYVRSAAARRAASELLERHGIDLLHADRERVAPMYASVDVAKVLDATDSISMYLQGVIRHGPPSERALAVLELPKMRRYERSMSEGYHSCLVTTEIDAAGIRATGTRARMEVLPNGIDESLLSCDRRPERDLVVFVGSMHYGPNVDGALWFTRHVWPRVRERRANARLALVGVGPVRAVRALARDPSIEVTGWVPSVRPYLERASAFVAPLRVGGGFPNKVAEALAAGVPVVATRAAHAGMADLEAGTHLLEADHAPGFADATVGLLEDSDLGSSLGAAGRSVVSAHYKWPRVLTRLEAIHSEAVAAHA